MKVFISQPMNGKSEQEILKERELLIKQVKERFASYGEIEILDSYFKDYEPSSGNIGLKFLAKSIELLADADVAIFANGWEFARGCRIEHLCAKEYGIDIIYSRVNDDEWRN